jgi:CRISPR-associated protein Cmx8
LAKTKTKDTPKVEVLTLNYQLAELPSSQHRAGLAGLVMVVDKWLWKHKEPKFIEKVNQGAICRITRQDASGAKLEINQAGLEALFDEIYAASTEEQARPQLLKNSRTKAVIPPRREETREETDAKGKVKQKTVYIYPVVVPRGSFLADSQYDKSSDGKNGHWIKLWRDLVWSILRGVPATRKPFEARADGNYTEDAAKVWKDLIQPETFTVDLPSTYFLGAQAFNAETVPFKDRARFQFLLHFWLFAAQIYIPAVINNEGKRDFVGYALAIPDVSDLEGFCDELPFVLSDRSPETPRYRPRDAIVDLAIESALDLLRRLRDHLTITTGEQATAYTVLGVDVIHAEKQGNNVRVLGTTRLDPDPPMVNEYSRIRNGYWSPLFRKQRLLNLVNHQPWYRGFDKLLCSLPYEQSIENDYFRRDVREAFQHEEKTMDEPTMNDEKVNDAKINELVFQFVRNYVGRKLESKYQLKWSEVKDKPDKKKEYEDKKEKIAKDAFLAVRSRTEQMDFINYFVSTLCSVPQHLKSEDYVSLTQELYKNHDRIRTLTLLALSANS